jgi:hypothetical protein
MRRSRSLTLSVTRDSAGNICINVSIGEVGVAMSSLYANRKKGTSSFIFNTRRIYKYENQAAHTEVLIGTHPNKNSPFLFPVHIVYVRMVFIAGVCNCKDALTQFSEGVFLCR